MAPTVSDGSGTATEVKELSALDQLIRQVQDNTATIRGVQRALEDAIGYLEGHSSPIPTTAEVDKSDPEGVINQLRHAVSDQSECLLRLETTIVSLRGAM